MNISAFAHLCKVKQKCMHSNAVVSACADQILNNACIIWHASCSRCAKCIAHDLYLALVVTIGKRLRCLVIDETIDGRYNPLKRQGYKRVLRAICKLKHRGKFVQVRASSCKFVHRTSSCKFVQVRASS